MFCPKTGNDIIGIITVEILNMGSVFLFKLNTNYYE
jgi:hypothetical protein